MHKAAPPKSHTIEFTSAGRTVIKPGSDRGKNRTPTAVATLRTDTFNTTQTEDSDYLFYGKILKKSRVGIWCPSLVPLLSPATRFWKSSQLTERSRYHFFYNLLFWTVNMLYLNQNLVNPLNFRRNSAGVSFNLCPYEPYGKFLVEGFKGDRFFPMSSLASLT